MYKKYKRIIILLFCILFLGVIYIGVLRSEERRVGK